MTGRRDASLAAAAWRKLCHSKTSGPTSGKYEAKVPGSYVNDCHSWGFLLEMAVKLRFGVSAALRRVNRKNSGVKHKTFTFRGNSAKKTASLLPDPRYHWGDLFRVQLTLAQISIFKCRMWNVTLTTISNGARMADNAHTSRPFKGKGSIKAIAPSKL